MAAPGWLPPVGLSAPGRDARAVSVEMSDAGSSVAVWMRGSTSGPGNVIQASTRPAGQGFSAPVELSPSGSEPILAMSPGGGAIVAWRELEGEVEEIDDEEFINTARQVIKVSVMSPGGSFSTPVDAYLAPPTIIKVIDSVPKTEQQGGNPQALRIEIDAGGDAILAWQENDPEAPATTVMAMTRSAAGVLSGATRVSPEPEAGEPSELPEVAIDDDGDSTVVWQHRGADGFVVEAATKPAGAGFEPPETLSGVLEEKEQAAVPDVGSSAAGETTVVWRRFVLEEESVVDASTRPPGGEFSEPEPVSASATTAFSPDLDVAPSGALIAVWLIAGEPNQVQGTVRPPGGAFSPPATISDADTDAEAESAAINSSGAAAVAWSALDEGEYTLQASVRAPGGGFGAPVPISGSGDSILRADLALDSFGDVSAAWNQSNGTHDIALVAGYDAFVPELRDLSIPTTAFVGEALTFAATPFDVWPTGPVSFNFGDGATASGNAVQHSYSAPGTYVVEATVTDPAGTAVSRQGQVVVRPRGNFSVGKLILDKKKGTAKLPVTVDGPGTVSVRGKGVKSARKVAGGAVSMKLPIKSVGGSLKKLKKKGKLKVSLTVTFAPDGGDPGSKPAKGTLRKKLG
ncbi:MAG TPA: PKD domain-containing protein [Solirubrobacterales bacterium]